MKKINFIYAALVITVVAAGVTSYIFHQATQLSEDEARWQTELQTSRATKLPRFQFNDLPVISLQTDSRGDFDLQHSLQNATVSTEAVPLSLSSPYDLSKYKNVSMRMLKKPAGNTDLFSIRVSLGSVRVKYDPAAHTWTFASNDYDSKESTLPVDTTTSKNGYVYHSIRFGDGCQYSVDYLMEVPNENTAWLDISFQQSDCALPDDSPLPSQNTFLDASLQKAVIDSIQLVTDTSEASRSVPTTENVFDTNPVSANSAQNGPYSLP